MWLLVYVFVLLLPLSGFAEEEKDPARGTNPYTFPTIGPNDTPEKYEERAIKEGWTFEWSVNREATQYRTGRIPPALKKTGVLEKRFRKMEGELPDAVDLRQRATLSPIKDQGNCGSCVYFATSSTLEDTFILRGITLPKTAPQYLMDCVQHQYRCNGSWFELVASGLVKNEGTAKESEYPYKAVTRGCQGQPEKIGRAVSYKIIDRSHKSILNALNSNYPVATTIGAGGSWMSYRSGTFNGCQSVGTNHQMVIEGYDCEGKCEFNSQGNLPNGKGVWLVRNSWGTSWGDEGWVRMKMTTSSGARCNNVAEEVGILDVDAPVPVTPTCSLAASPAKVKLGSEVTLTMMSANATEATIDGEKVNPGNGMRKIKPAAIGIFTANGNVVGAGGKGSCQATYEVTSDDPVPPPPGPDGGVPVWLWILLGALAVLAVGGLLWGYLNRKTEAEKKKRPHA